MLVSNPGDIGVPGKWHKIHNTYPEVEWHKALVISLVLNMQQQVITISFGGSFEHLHEEQYLNSWRWKWTKT